MTLPANSQQKKSDADAGIEVTDDFERFIQRNDVFSRAMWDDSLQSPKTNAFFASYRMEATPRRGDGFSQKDFALRNAAWLISDVVSDSSAKDGRREGFQAPIAADTPVASERLDVTDPSAMATEVKHIAKFFGADLCGVTNYDERWLYESRVDTRDM